MPPYLVALVLCLQSEVHLELCMLLLDIISHMHTTTKALVGCLIEQPVNGIAITASTMKSPLSQQLYTTTKISLTVSNKCRWTCGACTRSCFYQRCCHVRAVKESSYENDCCSPSVVFSLSHMCDRSRTNTQYNKKSVWPFT